MYKRGWEGVGHTTFIQPTHHTPRPFPTFDTHTHAGPAFHAQTQRLERAAFEEAQALRGESMGPELLAVLGP